MSDHFGKLCLKELKSFRKKTNIKNFGKLNIAKFYGFFSVKFYFLFVNLLLRFFKKIHHYKGNSTKNKKRKQVKKKK